jgi:peptide-methionine (S)-S-oxide reductase
MLSNRLNNAMVVALTATMCLNIACHNKRRDKPGREKMHETNHSEAVFAAGCFWGVEAVFRKVEGVVDATVGYTGGTVADPTYKQVCTGQTGHAEAVRVIFDPSVVSYEQLLEVFWTCHNPTTLNRQGPDVGTQYRSAIFFSGPQQRQAGETSRQKMQISGKFSNDIVTEITEAGIFYPAEAYHQRYFEKNGMGACNTGISKE